ncbi:MAG: hypothetical protein CMM60_08575 [Rhodospirillaceae bacterium]|jgi:hypothetical protein|nr:hypothetical protein [Rhodospirillaceae bacterium]|tara:strand:- start:1672 stop:2142 length:471 start_codon:yes stop_codon:yes gene_type:complete
MRGLKKFAVAAAVAAFAWTSLAPMPVAADVVFRATCGSLKGHRVNMDPDGKSKIENWMPEFYPAGPPPKGTGTLTFLSDDSDTGHIRVKWAGNEQSLPIVFKSETQISVADVDDFGVWIFSLYYRAGKVIVTRQTTNPGPGAVGALLTADCEFVGK